MALKITEAIEITVEDDNSLPTQTGQEGKYLTTDGTDAAWEPVDLTNIIDESETTGVVVTSGSGSVAITPTIGPSKLNGVLVIANNLSDVTPATARTNLQLGSAAVVNTGTAQGNVPLLGSGGVFPNSVLPPLAITATFVASSQGAMLAAGPTEGTVCVRADLNESFILTTAPATVLGNWQQLLSPPSPVSSVNGKVGVVALAPSDLTVGNITFTSTGSAAFVAGVTAATFSGIIHGTSTTAILNTAGAKPIRLISGVDTIGGGGSLEFRTLDVDGEDNLATVAAGEVYFLDLTVGDEDSNANISVDSDDGIFLLSAGAQINGVVQVGNDLQVTGSASITNTDTDAVGLSVQAASGQSAHLADFRGSDGTPNTYIDQNGYLVGAGNQLTGITFSQIGGSSPSPYSYDFGGISVSTLDGPAFDISSVGTSTYLLIANSLLGSTATVSFSGTWASTIIGAPFTLILSIDAAPITFDISSSLFTLPNGMPTTVTVTDVNGPCVLSGFMWTVPETGVFVFAVTQLVTDIALTSGG